MKSLQEILSDVLKRRPLDSQCVVPVVTSSRAIDSRDVDEWINSAAGIDTGLNRCATVIPAPIFGRNSVIYITRRGLEELYKRNSFTGAVPDIWYVQFKGYEPVFIFDSDAASAVKRARGYLFVCGKPTRLESVKKVNHA